MPEMTDPSSALASFQQELRRGTLRLQRGTVDRDLFVYPDNINGRVRLTYATLQGAVVTALAIFVVVDQVEESSDVLLVGVGSEGGVGDRRVASPTRRGRCGRLCDEHAFGSGRHYDGVLDRLCFDEAENFGAVVVESV